MSRGWRRLTLAFAVAVACVVIGLFFLRNELRACFGGCGADGCGVCGSVSQAPGP